jgi:hypothetical protein
MKKVNPAIFHQLLFEQCVLRSCHPKKKNEPEALFQADLLLRRGSRGLGEV